MPSPTPASAVSKIHLSPSACLRRRPAPRSQPPARTLPWLRQWPRNGSSQVNGPCCSTCSSNGPRCRTCPSSRQCLLRLPRDLLGPSSQTLWDSRGVHTELSSPFTATVRSAASLFPRLHSARFHCLGPHILSTSEWSTSSLPALTLPLLLTWTPQHLAGPKCLSFLRA